MFAVVRALTVIVAAPAKGANSRKERRMGKDDRFSGFSYGRYYA